MDTLTTSYVLNTVFKYFNKVQGSMLIKFINLYEETDFKLLHGLLYG